MDPHRKSWNEQHRRLRLALDNPASHRAAVPLFLSVHGMVHSAAACQGFDWSYPDEILAGVREAEFRQVPAGCAHSLAWLLWHMARIEDVTMNVLVAGDQQVFTRDKWSTRLQTRFRHTGNLMEVMAVRRLSAEIEIEALKAYRDTVGRQTQTLVQGLSPEEMKQRVDPARLQRLRDEGAVVEAASDLLAYWGRRTIAGLLLMPATRHNFVHLNEARRVRNKLRA